MSYDDWLARPYDDWPSVDDGKMGEQMHGVFKSDRLGNAEMVGICQTWEEARDMVKFLEGPTNRDPEATYWVESATDFDEHGEDGWQ